MKKQKICKWDLKYSSVVTVHIPLPNGKTTELKFNIAPDNSACDYVEEQLEDYGYEII
jgi:hypothetical protein